MVVEDVDSLARVEIAVNELIENVVKYRHEGELRVVSEVWQDGLGKTLRLTTENVATPDRLRQAKRLLTALRDSEDPMAFYDQLVLQTAPRRGVSGLGLARIRAESELALDFAVDGNRLRITVNVELDENGKLKPC